MAVGIVLWDNQSIKYPGYWRMKSSNEYGNETSYVFDNKFEVIGNIFDNPELLESEI